MTIANVNRCTGKIIIITISLKIFWCVQWAIILIKEEKVLAMLVVKSFGSCFEIMYEYSLPDLTNLLFYFRVIVEDHWWFKEKMVDLFLWVLSNQVTVVEIKTNPRFTREYQNSEIGSIEKFMKNFHDRSPSLWMQAKYNFWRTKVTSWELKMLNVCHFMYSVMFWLIIVFVFVIISFITIALIKCLSIFNGFSLGNYIEQKIRT